MIAVFLFRSMLRGPTSIFFRVIAFDIMSGVLRYKENDSIYISATSICLTCSLAT